MTPVAPLHSLQLNADNVTKPDCHLAISVASQTANAKHFSTITRNEDVSTREACNATPQDPYV